MDLNIKQLFKNLYKRCECNCGYLIPIFDKKGRYRKFVNGHYTNTIDQKGANSRTWKGGRYKDGNGYWRLFLPDYFSSFKDGYVYEHVYNYQEYHKLCMLPWGHVHHIISVKKGGSNLPWNLQGMTNREHASITNSRYMINRFCSQCGKTTTYFNKKRNKYSWCYDGKGGYLCKNCHRMNKYYELKKP